MDIRQYFRQLQLGDSASPKSLQNETFRQQEYIDNVDWDPTNSTEVKVMEYEGDSAIILG